MAKDDSWSLIWAALQALRAHYGPSIDRAAEGVGIPFGDWYGWLMAARIFEPDPISTERLGRRSNYTSPITLESCLAQGRRLGLLKSVGGEEYHLTPNGSVAVQSLIDTAYAAMAPIRPLAETDLERLAELLYRLVASSLAAPEPPDQWGLRMARRYDPGAGASVMVRLDQYLSDLEAYRDDAHLAAWQPLGVSGQAWEALTLLWRGLTPTLDGLCAKLAHRGYSREDYAAALDLLSARGWVAGNGQEWWLTGAGKALRDEAETATDRFFYAPWDCLTDDDRDELDRLLSGLRAGLERLRLPNASL